MKQKPLIDDDGVPSGGADDGQQLTPGGYPVDEVSSALQKSIRRGLEEDALYWCAEFYKARPHGIWKRLRIIASEDIGIASPSAALTVRALYENWKQSQDEGELYVVHAVLVLVYAKKSRLVDHATITSFGPRENGYKSLLAKRDVPEYAVDKHTARGRKLGRGFEHFFAEGARLENRSEAPDPYETRVRTALEK
jgi:replication-associated recombination protein RarA